MKKMSNSIGLIGGMGPFASAYFYRLLLEKSRSNFSAINNNDFPEILIDSVPVPDFISNSDGINLAREMLQDRVKKLCEAGAGVIVMVCNTGHILYPDLKEVAKEKLVSLIEIVSKEVVARGYSNVGVFGSPMTIKSRLYDQFLSNNGVKVVYPDKETIFELEQIIKRVVGGDIQPSDSTKLAILRDKFIKDEYLDGLILGCTELPQVYLNKNDLLVVDCLEVLADELLMRYYMGRSKYG